MFRRSNASFPFLCVDSLLSDDGHFELCFLLQVPEKKLKIVMADKELYKVCAVEVKRQIWQDNQALFGDEVSPLLKQYIVEKEAALFSSDVSVLHSFFSPSPKTRRQGEVRLTPPSGSTQTWTLHVLSDGSAVAGGPEADPDDR